MEPFATVQDYIARYGAVDDDACVTVMLSDASVFIASQPGVVVDESDENQKAVLRMVTCSVVHRSLASSAYAGFSSVSQGGDGYTASASVYNPGGDYYLTKQERRLLGVAGAQIGSIAASIRGYYGTNDAEAVGADA